MLIRCPSCKHPVEMSAETEEASFNSLTCPSCGSQLSLVDDTIQQRLLERRSVGHFLLLQHIGRGHFGDVWKARDTQLERTVAVKVPRRGTFDQSSADRFFREARAAAQLRHPNIVTIHEIGRDGGTIYIVSDFVDGMTLKEWIKLRALSPKQIATILRTIAESLDHAHEAGIVHRDLKPGNVLVDGQGNPWLTDFGLAKRDTAEITMTASGEILGTPAYMSPEQAAGQSHRADRRSDIYSLGVIMYEMLTGSLPFHGGTRMLLHQILENEPTPPRRVNPSLPRDLETICLKAMSKLPAARYSSAQEVADDLGRFIRGQPILARPTSQPERIWRWSRRNPAIAASALVSFLAVFGAMAASMRSQSERSPVIPTQTAPGKTVVHVSAEPRQVLLTTQPAGAEMTFIPLDGLSGVPLTGSKVSAGKSPVSVRLRPGYYLIEAVLDPERFHEVFRYVPESVETSSRSAHPHLDWEKEGDAIRLEAFEIPEGNVTEGMAWIEGAVDATLGSDEIPSAPRHTRDVPGFFIDPGEVTLGAFLKEKMLPPSSHPDHKQRSDDHAVVFINWDLAASYAESVGKRLLDEWEFEIAATNAGSKKFPWGDDAAQITQWPFDPVGSPEYDRVNNDPPVFGLYSNVAEWTSTWFLPDPTRPENDTVPLAEQQRRRVIRGGPYSVVQGQPVLAECRVGPVTRIGVHAMTWSPGLGFRCGRSPRPRLIPADFPQLVRE